MLGSGINAAEFVWAGFGCVRQEGRSWVPIGSEGMGHLGLRCGKGEVAVAAGGGGGGRN